jgi:hypothetical protein
MAFVQAAVGRGTSGTSQAAVMGSPITGGNAVLVAVGCSGGIAAANFTVTDDKGNSYSAVATTRVTSGTFAHQLFFATGVTGGGTTITASVDSGGAIDVVAAEVSNSAVDVATAATGSSTTPASGAIAPAALETVLCFVTCDDTGLSANTLTKATGWFLGAGASGDGLGHSSCGVEQRTVSGSNNPGWTLANSAVWGCSIAAVTGSPAALPALDDDGLTWQTVTRY